MGEPRILERCAPEVGAFKIALRAAPLGHQASEIGRVKGKRLSRQPQAHADDDGRHPARFHGVQAHEMGVGPTNDNRLTTHPDHGAFPEETTLSSSGSDGLPTKPTFRSPSLEFTGSKRAPKIWSVGLGGGVLAVF